MCKRNRPGALRVIGLVLVLVVLLGFPGVCGATWSIAFYDSSTGEIAIGSATCLTAFDLLEWVPVMLVGVGAGCAQSRIDGGAVNRMIMWEELQKGTHPRDILAIIRQRDSNWQQRQFGLIDALGRRASHTGTRNGQWAGHVRGKIGTINYSIQGNVLTGQPVVDMILDALTNTPGDVAEKLMACMEAAYSMGGDGRCSCGNPPDGCGSPPPDFDKSAHVGFMVSSRIGDVDGECTAINGCANGEYYMKLNVADQGQDDEDPVLQLRKLFDAWRDDLRGRPDHILSDRSFSLDSIPGNGTATSVLTLTPRDWEGTAVGAGLQISVNHYAGSAGLSTIGDAVDHGDGSYSVQMTAGTGQGTDLFEVLVDNGDGGVLLYPIPELVHSETLLADRVDLSASAGGTVSLSLHGPEDATGMDYLVIASASGTEPGFDIYGVHVPLNPDPVLTYSYVYRNSSVFVNTEGTLAPDGTQNAFFVAPPGLLDGLVGGALDFAFLTMSPTTFASNAVTVSVTP